MARPHLDRAFMVILGLERVEQFSEIVRHHEEGTVPQTVMWGACPTLFDPTQAPPGRHTAFMWEKLPYRLRGDPASWDREKEAHGRALLDLWAEHAPNLRDAVLSSFTRSPLDTEWRAGSRRSCDSHSSSEGSCTWSPRKPMTSSSRTRREQSQKVGKGWGS